MRIRPKTILPFALIAIVACGESTPDAEPEESILAPGMNASEMSAMVAQFETSDIDFDATVLEPWERAVITKLVEASDIMHEIFSLQVFPENPDWQTRLAAFDGPGESRPLICGSFKTL